MGRKSTSSSLIAGTATKVLTDGQRFGVFEDKKTVAVTAVEDTPWFEAGAYTRPLSAQLKRIPWGRGAFRGCSGGV